MKIYVYRSNDLHPERSVRLLSTLLGMRYMAFTGKYPHGKRLAFGYTLRGTIRKAKRKARERDRSDDWKSARPLIVDV